MVLAVTNAGKELTLLQPWLYFAQRLTPVPPPNHAFREPWPTGWVRYQNFADGITVKFENPKVAIPSSDNGRLATLPSGEDAITLEVSFQTPDQWLVNKTTGMVQEMAAAVPADSAAGTEGSPAITSNYFDPNADQNIMLGIEGYAASGGLMEAGQIVRFFAYNVEPGEAESGGGRGGGGGGRRGGGGGGGRGRGGEAEPGSIKFDHGGEDGPVKVALPLSALPEPGIDQVFAGLEYPPALIDPRGRANWFNYEVAV